MTSLAKIALKNIPMLLIVILGTLLYFSKNSIAENWSDFQDKADQEKDDSSKTISNSQANAFAEQLYDAMARLNDDEEKIYNVFRQLKNEDDFNAVYNAFGKRQYSRFWSNEGDPVFSSNYDLIQWLVYNLEPEELQKITSIFPYISF